MSLYQIFPPFSDYEIMDTYGQLKDCGVIKV